MSIPEQKVPTQLVYSENEGSIAVDECWQLNYIGRLPETEDVVTINIYRHKTESRGLIVVHRTTK